MKLVNCLIIGTDDSRVELTVDELHHVQGNLFVPIERFNEWLSDPDAWGYYKGPSLDDKQVAESNRSTVDEKVIA